MSKKKVNKKRTHRTQAARREREERMRRIFTWGAILVFAAVFGVLIYGAVNELVIKPNQPVAEVNGVPISKEAFQARVRYERLVTQTQINNLDEFINQLDPNNEAMQSYIQQYTIQKYNLQHQLEMPELFAGQVLDKMVEEELVRQKAAEAGLTVSEEEIDREIEQMMGYDREAAATATVTETQQGLVMTEDQYHQLYENFKKNYLEASGMSEEAFREMVKANLLRDQVKEVVAGDIPKDEDQVKIAYFVLPDEETARQIQQRLDAGEDPQTIIDELNGDDDEGTAGAELDWEPLGFFSSQISPEFESQVFSRPVGKATDPVLGPNDRYFVGYVIGHEVRPLADSIYQQKVDEAYNAWVQAQIKDHVDYYDWQEAVPPAETPVQP